MRSEGQATESLHATEWGEERRETTNRAAVVEQKRMRQRYTLIGACVRSVCAVCDDTLEKRTELESVELRDKRVMLHFGDISSR